MVLADNRCLLMAEELNSWAMESGPRLQSPQSPSAVRRLEHVGTSVPDGTQKRREEVVPRKESGNSRTTREHLLPPTTSCFSLGTPGFPLLLPDWKSCFPLQPDVVVRFHVGLFQGVPTTPVSLNEIKHCLNKPKCAFW